MQIINKFSREEQFTGNHVQYFAGLTLKLMKKDIDEDGIFIQTHDKIKKIDFTNIKQANVIISFS